MGIEWVVAVILMVLSLNYFRRIRPTPPIQRKTMTAHVDCGYRDRRFCWPCIRGARRRRYLRHWQAQVSSVENVRLNAALPAVRSRHASMYPSTGTGICQSQTDEWRRTRVCVTSLEKMPMQRIRYKLQVSGPRV
ncbi:hypothetical protein B0H21DRAFT_719742 [Amylocystis lapponica]|nr:hypothetical protein B0H21DRAFT_719742 [Amylocystis lapponica]